MKTSALNDGTSCLPKSNNSSGLSQQPQVMARPDTLHGGEDLLLSDEMTKTEVTHIPLTWVLPQKYLSRQNNTPSLPVFLTPCVAIQPENAAPLIVTVHTLHINACIMLNCHTIICQFVHASNIVRQKSSKTNQIVGIFSDFNALSLISDF